MVWRFLLGRLVQMSNQEKFTTWSSKLKVHRANSQIMSSYLFRFSTDILFSSLVSFAFCYLGLYFEIKSIYSDAHSTMRAVEWQNKISPGRLAEKRLYLFWSFLVYKRMWNVCKRLGHSKSWPPLTASNKRCFKVCTTMFLDERCNTLPKHSYMT